MSKKIASVLKNGGLFLLLSILTIYMVLKDNSPAEMTEALSRADYRYLLLGVCAMGIFLICEGINISRCLRLFSGDKIPCRLGVKYAMTGFFFSSVTPSATGGQPMQLYYMHRDGIQISHGTLALLFELLSFQTVTIGLAIIGFFWQQETITTSMGNLRYLLLIGVALNAAVMLFLVCAVFSNKMVVRAADFVVKLVQLFSRDKAENLRQKFFSQIEEYHKSARCLKQHKAMFAKTAATTLMQVLAMYSVPFLVYKSFGLSAYTMGEVIALQAVLYVAVSSLPLPGAVGVSESAFMMLFSTLFTAEILPGAMLLSRGISFYLFVLISGLASAFFIIKKRGKKYGVYHSDCRRRQGHCRASEALSGKQRIQDRYSL